MKSKSLSDITDLDILSKILPGIILDDLNSVSNSKKADTIVILLNLLNKLLIINFNYKPIITVLTNKGKFS